MMLKRRSDLLLLWSCWIVSWLDVGFGVRVLVQLLDAKRSYLYEGMVANFGNLLDSEPYYDANLAIPPGDPELCEYPSALEHHLNTTRNSTFRRTNQRSPIALLVKRGNCSFLTKALVALEISRQSSKWTVDLVLVYNNNKTEGSTLLTPSSNATKQENTDLQALGLVFLSAKSGTDLLDQISSAERAQNASAVLRAPKFNKWKFGIAVQQRAPDGNPPPSNSNGSGGQPQSSGGGDATPSFYWFRFVLFSILILSPCLRAGYLWYAGGGRLRFRYNEQGRIIGIQYIPPMPYWYGSTFIPAARPSDVTPCLTEDQVRALPIITYQPPPQSGDDDDESTEEEEHDIRADGKHPRTNEQKDEEMGRPAPTTSRTDTSQEEHDEIHVPPQQQAPSTEPQYTTSCTTCSICIDDFRPGEQLRLLPLCRHAFHTECIMPWLTERQGCCPLCKSCVLETQENTDVESSDQSEPTAQPESAPPYVQQSSPPIAPMPASYAISSNASPPAQPSALSIDLLPEQSSPLPAASTPLTQPAIILPPTTPPDADSHTTPFERVQSAPPRS